MAHNKTIFKKLRGVILRPLLDTVALLALCVPIKKGRCVLLLDNCAYGNVRALAQYIKRNPDPNLSALMVVRKEKDLLEAKKLGLPFYIKSNPLSYWYEITAEFQIIETGVKVHESINSTVINLWHGMPLKKIILDDRFVDKTNRIVVPSKRLKNNVLCGRFRSPDYIISPGGVDAAAKLKSAFGMQDKKCLKYGYPRTDVFFAPDKTEFDTLGLPENKKIFLYMPTFRDTGKNPFDEQLVDWQAINRSLKKQQAVMLVKAHMATEADDNTFHNLDRIVFMPNDKSIYNILPFVDTLITDYSSIYFDFLLLDKKIIFFPFDYDDYITNCREMYFDYQDATPGEKVYSTPELIKALKNTTDPYKHARHTWKERVWGTNYKGDACEKLVGFILSEQKRPDRI